MKNRTGSCQNWTGLGPKPDEKPARSGVFDRTQGLLRLVAIIVNNKRMKIIIIIIIMMVIKYKLNTTKTKEKITMKC